MGLVSTENVQMSSFGSYHDPRLPTGRWGLTATATGDTSGGDVDISIVFEGGVTFFRSVGGIYSMEFVNARRSGTTVEDVTVRVQSFEYIHDTQSMVFVLEGKGGTGGGGGGNRWITPYQLILGRRRGGHNLTITFNFPTNNNGETYACTSWGYYWHDADVMDYPGGPIRPEDAAMLNHLPASPSGTTHFYDRLRSGAITPGIGSIPVGTPGASFSGDVPLPFAVNGRTSSQVGFQINEGVPMGDRAAVNQGGVVGGGTSSQVGFQINEGGVPLTALVPGRPTGAWSESSSQVGFQINEPGALPGVVAHERERARQIATAKKGEEIAAGRTASQRRLMLELL
jgi:hypothetical protein